jgi:hypothetical protein
VPVAEAVPAGHVEPLPPATGDEHIPWEEERSAPQKDQAAADRTMDDIMKRLRT